MRALKRKLDYSDLLATPDDGKRYELLRGQLFVNPSPNTQHQRISRRLLVLLVHYLEAHPLGEVFSAPTDVILTPHDVFVPDLVVCDPQHIKHRGIEGPPLLVVEILSPSTRKHDRGPKAERYAELGTQHYWIVDPIKERFEYHRLVKDAFQPVTTTGGPARLVHPDWDDLEIDLEALWHD